MENTNKILITGGCGFIGSNLINYLRRTGGPEIIVLDNESLGKYDDIAEFDVEFIKGDLRDLSLIKKIVKDVDAVIHLAADTRVMDSIENPELNFEINTVGTFGLLMAIKEAGVKKIINASTGGAILGEAVPPVHEEMTAKPASPYGASKLAVEGYLSAFAASYDIFSTSLRFSNVFGPRSYRKGSVVAHYFKQILAGNPLHVYGDGSQTRDYIYVDDLCLGIIAALNLNKVGVFQLGSGIPTTINQLIDLIKQTIGTKYNIEVQYLSFRDGELRHTWCDINKARTELLFNPETNLKEGLAETWKWFINNY